jgi:hypothetical protein
MTPPQPRPFIAYELAPFVFESSDDELDLDLNLLSDVPHAIKEQ